MVSIPTRTISKSYLSSAWSHVLARYILGVWFSWRVILDGVSCVASPGKLLTWHFLKENILFTHTQSIKYIYKTFNHFTVVFRIHHTINRTSLVIYDIPSFDSRWSTRVESRTRTLHGIVNASPASTAARCWRVRSSRVAMRSPSVQTASRRFSLRNAVDAPSLWQVNRLTIQSSRLPIHSLLQINDSFTPPD